MKKITLLLALLLSFTTAALADDYNIATEAGVEPTYSTADGTQYAYYLRNVKYSSSFMYNPGPMGVTTDASKAIKVSVEQGTNGALLYILNDDDSRTGLKIQANGPAKLWAMEKNANATFEHKLEKASISATAYFLKSLNNNGVSVSGKDICAKVENMSDSNMYGYMYGTATASDEAYMWQFIPANQAAMDKAGFLTLKVAEGDASNGNLASFSASKAVTVPSGYEVYTASYDSDNSVLKLTQLSGDVIPANVGVIIKGDVTTGLKMAYADTQDDANAVYSALIATADESKTVAEGETVYALGMPSGSTTLGFFKVAEGTTIGAHKAYLKPSTGEQANAIALAFGSTTSIGKATANASSTAPTYDLTGRRVAKTVKGSLYIQGGKKFIAQ